MLIPLDCRFRIVGLLRPPEAPIRIFVPASADRAHIPKYLREKSGTSFPNHLLSGLGVKICSAKDVALAERQSIPLAPE